jgi:RND family efflux transporter MFP subunit
VKSIARVLLLGLTVVIFHARAAEGRTVELTTQVPGAVAEVLVHEGQSVRKGQVLVRLDSVVYQARVQEAEADLKRLSAEADEAGRDRDRVQELYNRAVTSTTELEAANLRFTRAESALEAGKARLVIARKNLADTELRAPFDARVVRRLAEPGVVVNLDCRPTVLLAVRRTVHKP